MAISQNKYIDIGSQVVDTGISERRLCGLIICSDEMINNFSLKAEYDSGNVVYLQESNYANAFSSSTNAYKFAQKYFSYTSPTGSSPQYLACYKVSSSDPGNPQSIIESIIEKTENFSTYCFLNSSKSSPENISTAYSYTAGLNFKFLAVHYIDSTDLPTTSDIVEEADALKDIQGVHVVCGPDVSYTAIPMAILASTNYNRINSVPCLMYKRFPNVTADITSDDVYDTLTEHNVNFYGQTQANGNNLAFYQRGFNTDGTDTAIYHNEIWLKSRIVSEFFNLAISVQKIPANYVGVGMIRNFILPVVDLAIQNGTILPNKNLTQTMRSKIFFLSGDEDAADIVAAIGYWLDIDIQYDGNEYKAYYTLIYSKGDAIRKVEGTHILV